MTTAPPSQRWPLVGREAELAIVRDAVAAGAGGVVLVGPAGVGKTRLATEAAAVADGLGRRVEWVRATRSAGSIPLGAFAPLLPVAGVAGGGAGVLVAAHAALAELGRGRGLVLCADDAHLLDDASAALLHGLVAARGAVAVVTVRAGEPAPDAVGALWKDELCAHVPVGELAREEVARLSARRSAASSTAAAWPRCGS